MKAHFFAALLACLCAACSQMPLPPMQSGFLCCNMRTDGKWISDSNYAASEKYIIPLGTPVKVLGYDDDAIEVEISGRRQTIGNDYSRNLGMDAFTRRYIVERDPTQSMAGLPPKIQRAMQTMRVTKGMTREQVAIALGYPISSENAHLDGPKWRYWLGTFTPFTVNFGGDDKVLDVTTDPETLAKVFLE